MSDLNYQVSIDTKGAERSLDGLKSQIAGFGSAIAGAFAFKEIAQVAGKFQDLRSSLSILYKDVETGAKVFDDIKKFAASSVFSVNDLTETVIKLKAAGLDPTISQLQLFANTSSVAADSVGALQAITDLYARTTAGGLGLEDLNRLADRGIPVFTILSERLGLSRLEISKVGQTAGGAAIILKALEDGLNDAFGGASAARANNVSQAVSNLGDAFDNAADTVGTSGLNQGLTDFYKSLTGILQTINPLLKGIGQLLGGAFSFLAENIKLATAIAVGFIATLAVGRIIAIGGALLNLSKSFALFNMVAGKNPLVKVLSLALGAAAAVGILSTETDDLSGEIDKLNAEGEKLGQNNGFKYLQDGKLGAGTANLKKEILQFNEGLKGFKVEMDNVVISFKRLNDQNVNAINLETALIGTSTELQRIRQADAEITRNAAEEIARLVEEKAKLTEAERKEGRGEIIDKTIAKIKEQAEIDKEATTEAIKNSEQRIRSRNLELFSIESQIDVSNELARIQHEIATSTMSAIEKKYADIDLAARESAKAQIDSWEKINGMKMDPAEARAYYEAAAAGSEKLKAKQKELYDQSREFSTGWKRAFREYADNATNAARQAERIFQKATSGMEDLIVNFAKTGKFEWKTFVSSMLEELLRSQIQVIFSSLMGGMSESMGGVFGNNNAGMGASGGGGGILDSILGGIGSIFGMGGGSGNGSGSSANNPVFVYDVGGGGGGGGGMIDSVMGGQQGQPSVLGNVWEGIKTTAGNVWEGIKSVGSGVLDVIGSVGSSVWEGIKSVGGGVVDAIGGIFSGFGGGSSGDGGGSFLGDIASGIGDFFGGFFANGGTLGAGKWGIAGENGPELISGPANITPMGGSTMVTYNINAVDAMSFKTMLAQDPSFIYGLTMQGAKGVPARR
jgi:lambda family phage tail tape measure protein